MVWELVLPFSGLEGACGVGVGPPIQWVGGSALWCINTSIKLIKHIKGGGGET